MDKLDGMSLDIEYTEKEKLKSIFPQCFVEGKLDVQKLLDLCGEYELKDFERYEFTWHGKSECLKNAQTRSKGTLRPCIEESKNFDDTQNLYIEGDNLEVLKLLQTSYYNKVKMIYIDPPYNTGKDFIYPDNFTDSLANYKEITSQATKSNPETMGRFHTDWLNMIYPRLRLAYNLLKDDGVIFISIDDNEVHNLRKVCDEVFGEENFVSSISNTNNPKGRSDDKYVATAHENILIYAKNIDNLEWYGFEATNEITKRYNKVDSDGRKYREIDLRKTGENDLREDRPNLFYYFYFNEKTGDFFSSRDDKDIQGYIKIKPQREDGKEGNWRWGLDNTQTNINKLLPKFMPNRKIWGVMEKDFLEDRGLVKPTSSWVFKDVNSERGTEEYIKLGFDKRIFLKPKPIGTISRCLKLSTSIDDIVLDFFSGSATTAHAVMDLNAQDGGNRKFILVQLPELCEENTEAYKNGYKNICEIGKERIRRAGSKIEKEINEYNQQLKIGDEEKQMIDTGFKVLKLDTSNVKIWDNTSLEKMEEDKQIDMFTERLNSMVEAVKNDRTDLDLVYEILLKEGVELTETIIPQDFGGKKGYIVREDALLIICLDKDLKAEHVAEMVEYAPSTIVFAEDSFTNVDEIENAKVKVDEKLGFEHGDKVKFRFV